MRRNVIRSIGALLITAVIGASSFAQVGPGMPKPPPPGQPSGGAGGKMPKKIQDGIKKILADGRAQGLTSAQIKANILAYLKSQGY